MSYRIKKREVLPAALARIAASEIESAMAELRRRDRGEAIHSARKSIKRIRALLHALRPIFPGKLFRSEDQRFAEAGRKISPLRDIHVQLQTLDKLSAANDRAAGRLRRDLLRRQRNIIRKIPGLKKVVRWMLANSRERVKSWPLDDTTSKTLTAGLKRIYKQGRRAFETARRNPAPENLHRWRKKVKALGYGLELVKGLAPRKFSKRISWCEKLGMLWGDEHDLFMVRQALLRDNKHRLPGDGAGLARRISLRRFHLRKHAFKLGNKVYSDKPRVFVTHLGRFLAR